MTGETTIRDQQARAAAKKLETYEWGFHSDIEQEFAPRLADRDACGQLRVQQGEERVSREPIRRPAPAHER